MAEREFKGVWIPAAIWLDDRLNALDKIILAEIDSLDNGEDHCHAGNEYLAQFCQCSVSKVSKTVAKLVELGYIAVHSFDGRQRKLQSCIVNFTTLPDKKCQAACEKMPTTNIGISKAIKSNTPSGVEPEILPGFEAFWAVYPKKEARKAAIKAWKKLKPGEALQKTITEDIRRRLDGEWKDRDKQYIPHAATYLNGARWEDEPPTAPAPEPQQETPWWELPPDEQIRRAALIDAKEREKLIHRGEKS